MPFTWGYFRQGVEYEARLTTREEPALLSLMIDHRYIDLWYRRQVLNVPLLL